MFHQVEACVHSVPVVMMLVLLAGDTAVTEVAEYLYCRLIQLMTVEFSRYALRELLSGTHLRNAGGPHSCSRW